IRYVEAVLGRAPFPSPPSSRGNTGSNPERDLVVRLVSSRSPSRGSPLRFDAEAQERISPSCRHAASIPEDNRLPLADRDAELPRREPPLLASDEGPQHEGVAGTDR